MTLRVTTRKLKVDEIRFSFEYIIFINGKFRKKGVYDEKHEWGDMLKELKQLLTKENLALIALETLKEDGHL